MAFVLPAYAVEGWAFRLVVNREVLRSSLTGVTQVAMRPGSFWSAEFQTRRMRRGDGEKIAAALQRGFSEPFYLSPPNATAPIEGTGYGTPRVAGGGQTGKSLITDGWSPGFTLRGGDWLSFTNGTFEELHRCAYDVTAGGGGTLTIPLVRGILRSPADNQTLRLQDPRGEFLLNGTEFGSNVDFNGTIGASFTAFEFIR